MGTQKVRTQPVGGARSAVCLTDVKMKHARHTHVTRKWAIVPPVGDLGYSRYSLINDAPQCRPDPSAKKQINCPFFTRPSRRSSSIKMGIVAPDVLP